MLQKVYFYLSNYGIPFLYELVLSMIYLSVVKLISEGACSDTNCWITERRDESIIEKYYPFKPYNPSFISMKYYHPITAE
jgi:hypothetical protein